MKKYSKKFLECICSPEKGITFLKPKKEDIKKVHAS